MNEILLLKGKFEQKDWSSHFGPSNIPKNKFVTAEHLINLKNDLCSVYQFWEEEKLSINPLISLYYIDIIAKSNRVKAILDNDIKKNNDSIVGAKFAQGNRQKHIITHCVKKDVILDAINNLDKVISIVATYFNKSITYDDLDKINSNNYSHLLKKKDISKKRFVNTIVDAYYLEKFGIEQDHNDLEENAIISIYDTKTKTVDIMKQLGINFLNFNSKSINETTFFLNVDQYRLLKSKAPYLIAMSLSDLQPLKKENIDKTGEKDVIDSDMSIPDPGNEPTIGVIDTMFDQRVYFSKWVEFKNMLHSEIEISLEDYHHGTMVTSLIVDGPRINNDNDLLNDGCGFFKVRHFGVCKHRAFSLFTVIKLIKEIIENNRDIKVWNLSLGSMLEINSNFISPLADFLDKIQYENDIIFVISGTNKPENSKITKIGSPADSINSIVVNSVNFNGTPASYSRQGPVLSFFNKPDISYYGGEADGKKIKAFSPYGIKEIMGTSFAAPWIARKVAYLIHVVNLPRELAKALIVDSATGWHNQLQNPRLVGHGVVKTKINQILSTEEDEIKFMISGISEKFDTYNYNLHVPVEKQKHPFVSKATLCYFPKCSRNQGIDYTNIEMDIQFGRVENTAKGGVKIVTINDNIQYNDLNLPMPEKTARRLYRKWDNIKHIRENIETKNGNKRKAKSKKQEGMWGISIKTNERLNLKESNNLKFGPVITLKEINGVNRIQEFIQQCSAKGWIVNKINVENQIDIYNKAQEELKFE